MLPHLQVDRTLNHPSVSSSCVATNPGCAMPVCIFATTSAAAFPSKVLRKSLIEITMEITDLIGTSMYLAGPQPVLPHRHQRWAAAPACVRRCTDAGPRRRHGRRPHAAAAHAGVDRQAGATAATAAAATAGAAPASGGGGGGGPAGDIQTVACVARRQLPGGVAVRRFQRHALRLRRHALRHCAQHPAHISGARRRRQA